MVKKSVESETQALVRPWQLSDSALLLFKNTMQMA